MNKNPHNGGYITIEDGRGVSDELLSIKSYFKLKSFERKIFGKRG